MTHWTFQLLNTILHNSLKMFSVHSICYHHTVKEQRFQFVKFHLQDPSRDTDKQLHINLWKRGVWTEIILTLVSSIFLCSFRM